MLKRACLAILLPTTLLAGPYDGTYRPNFDWAAGWDCKTIGVDGGALAVSNGQLHGVENTCDLTNPVSVRDMPATLYDAQCAGEGMTNNERIMLMTAGDVLIVIRPGSVVEWKRCQ